MRAAPLVLAVALMGCADSGATITVTADESIARAQVVLNDKDIAVERLSRRTIRATWDGGEASGVLRVFLDDGTPVDCGIGYIEGSNLYHERFVIRNRRCEPAK